MLDSVCPGGSEERGRVWDFPYPPNGDIGGDNKSKKEGTGSSDVLEIVM